MQRHCLKCGTDADVQGDPLDACPKCGAIYSRVEAALAPKAVAKPVPRKPFPTKPVVAVLSVALLAPLAWFGWHYLVQQRAIAQWQSDQKLIANMSDRLVDSMKLASSTSRIALAGPVGQLQALSREVRELPVQSDCMRLAQLRLADGIKAGAGSFMAFMAQDEDQSPALAAESEHLIDLAVKQVETCRLQAGAPKP